MLAQSDDGGKNVLQDIALSTDKQSLSSLVNALEEQGYYVPGSRNSGFENNEQRCFRPGIKEPL